MRAFLKVVLVIVIILAVALIGIYINHTTESKYEKELINPIGKQVFVNGKQMSVYIEGEGEQTLVFMAGAGTAAPVYDFRSLYSLLSSNYKIVVVERFGYGYSDVVDEDRDIDTVLKETRTALEKAEIKGPFILCPHSMAGLEALYWAQQYPDEVKAIIGLDMCVPETYDDFEVNNLTYLKIRGIRLATKIGITRLIPNAADGDAIKHGTLTDGEKAISRAIFYRRIASKPMLNEAKAVKDNAAKVKKGNVPQIPMLMFVSNGTDTGIEAATWKSYPKKYLEKVENGEMIELDCPHYVHNYEYESISESITDFVSKLDKKDKKSNLTT